MNKDRHEELKSISHKQRLLRQVFILPDVFSSLIKSFLTLCLALLCLTSCTTLDKTNIQPEQEIPGLGFVFTVPDTHPSIDTSWFSVVYGNSNRIRLSQINSSDSFAIEAILNKGPRKGMYQEAEKHLMDLKKHISLERRSRGFKLSHHEEWIDESFGALCLRYSSEGQDYRGRVGKGPALVEARGLICPHQTIDNVLLTLELTRRSDNDAIDIDLSKIANKLFRSVTYHELDD